MDPSHEPQRQATRSRAVVSATSVPPGHESDPLSKWHLLGVQGVGFRVKRFRV